MWKKETVQVQWICSRLYSIRHKAKRRGINKDQHYSYLTIVVSEITKLNLRSGVFVVGLGWENFETDDNWWLHVIANSWIFQKIIIKKIAAFACMPVHEGGEKGDDE